MNNIDHNNIITKTIAFILFILEVMILIITKIIRIIAKVTTE